MKKFKFINFMFLFLVVFLCFACSTSVDVQFENNGEIVETKSFTKNHVLIESDFPDVENIGYEFTGWYFKDGVKYEDQKIDSDITLYSHWKPINIVVTFQNGDVIVTTKSFIYNSALNESDFPSVSKDGYFFDGWYFKGGAKYNNENLIENTTFECKWTSVTNLDVSFIIDGKETIVKSPENQVIAKPQDPVKEGYDFVGWFVGEDEWDFSTILTEAISLTAKFNPKSASYTIEHWVEGEEDARDNDVLSALVGDVVYATYKDYSGEDLYPTGENSGIVLADNSLVIKVIYKKLDFTFNYVLNGGNQTYPTRMDMTLDFLADYSKFKNTTYTYDSYTETFINGNFKNIDLHVFLFEYKEKWGWMMDYLKTAGSSTNKKACAILYDNNTATEFENSTAFDSGKNQTFALAYEVRGFVMGIKYTYNVNWSSSDYASVSIGNGFWDIFVQNREVVSFSGNKEPVVLTQTVYKEGLVFDGWYLKADFSGEPVTTISSDATVYAKWVPSVLADEIVIENAPAIMKKAENLTLKYSVLPDDVYFKTVTFKSSNPEVVLVDINGKLTAGKIGKATITITSTHYQVSKSFEIEVISENDVLIDFSENYKGFLEVNKTCNLLVTGIKDYLDGAFTFISKNTNIATIDAQGLITAKSVGNCTIEVYLNENLIMTFEVSVVNITQATRVSDLMNLLLQNTNPVIETLDVKLLWDEVAKLQYYSGTYGSVNLFLADNLNLDATTYLITDRNLTKMSEINFITIHDTANINGDLKGHGDYWKSTTSVSIHYTVGDYGVIADLPDEYRAAHAGDGSRTVTWEKTNVSKGQNKPVFDISADGKFLIIDGVQTTVAIPAHKNGITVDKSYLMSIGPSYRIVDNKYEIAGPLAFDYSQNLRGVITHGGGNRSSVGIEMCVNTTGDIYDTWQRTAKLVAKLLLDKDLPINRVTQHNNYSGKNCPQSIRSSNYWDTFMAMVELEYIIQKDYSDAVISIKSKNTDILSNSGRIVSKPLKTTSVNYTLEVKIGTEVLAVDLCAVVPGTSTWNNLVGYYPI